MQFKAEDEVLRVSTRALAKGADWLLRVNGVVDRQSVPGLEEALADVARMAPRRVLLDLREALCTDHASGALDTLGALLTAQGIRFRIRCRRSFHRLGV